MEVKIIWEERRTAFAKHERSHFIIAESTIVVRVTILFLTSNGKRLVRNVLLILCYCNSGVVVVVAVRCWWRNTAKYKVCKSYGLSE